MPIQQKIDKGYTLMLKHYSASKYKGCMCNVGLAHACPSIVAGMVLIWLASIHPVYSEMNTCEQNGSHAPFN